MFSLKFRIFTYVKVSIYNRYESFIPLYSDTDKIVLKILENQCYMIPHSKYISSKYFSGFI